MFRYIDAGGYHGCGITTSEQLLCWGYNADGQLGLGSTALVTNPDADPRRLSLSTDRRRLLSSCAFTLAFEAWCWGNNGDGRLGDGSTATQSTTPVAVITAQVTRHPCGRYVVVGQRAAPGARVVSRGSRTLAAWTVAARLVLGTEWRRSARQGRASTTSSRRPRQHHRALQGRERRRTAYLWHHRRWRRRVLGIQCRRPARRWVDCHLVHCQSTCPRNVSHRSAGDLPLARSRLPAAARVRLSPRATITPAESPRQGRRCAGGSTSTASSETAPRPIVPSPATVAGGTHTFAADHCRASPHLRAGYDRRGLVLGRQHLRRAR